MENLEDELSEIINATSPQDSEIEVMATPDVGPLNPIENLNDSVEIIENPIEVLDLTSPQPSTSSSNSAGAVGTTSIVKRNLEETLKDNTEQNPSTSSGNATSSGNSTNNILECPICLQTCIHPARLPCGHIFCFLCVKGVAYKNRRCAMCRREIPPEFLDHPQLVNGIEDICTTKATDDGYQWFYEGRNGGWWEYEQRNASEIEEAFQNSFHKKFSYHEFLLNILKIQTELKKKENRRDNHEDEDYDDGDEFVREGEARDNIRNQKTENPFTHNIQIYGQLYTVDFENMIQYPVDMPYRKRKICRAKGLPSKGVAGIFTSRKTQRTRPY